MSKVLFIKGHPGNSQTSISVQMLERFQADHKKNYPNDKIETIDLYNDNIPLIDAEVMSAWTKFQTGKATEITASEETKVARMNQLADQFVAADTIIFAAPMWNFGYPPMVKAYMDAAMMVAGKTFNYSPNGPIALLKDLGKKAIILEASGSHLTGTPNEAYTHASNHLKGILNFVGIMDVQLVAAEGVSQFPDKKNAIISAALEKVSNLAAAA
jgi:FMN-dependent NADH-azoreductase